MNPPSALQSMQKTLEWLSQPRLTVLFFLLTALCAFIVQRWNVAATWMMLLPFSLLVISLVATIITNRRFRTDTPLLVLHLCLLVLAILFLVGRLTYLEGRVTLTQDVAFSGNLDLDIRGPLHGDSIKRVRFMNAGLTEVYPQPGAYRHTYNQVIWWDDAGTPHVAEIGDDRPLLMNGYRISTSRQRGVSPVLKWQPNDGTPPVLGSLQLGQTMANVFDSAASVPLPNGLSAWVGLESKPGAVPKRIGEQADMGVYSMDHVLIIRIGETRHELRIGDSIDIPGGRLSYEKVLTWMGYRVAYDPTISWIVATIAIGVGSLIWFYVKRVFTRPLLKEST